jgi:hypothetical protein
MLYQLNCSVVRFFFIFSYLISFIKNLTYPMDMLQKINNFNKDIWCL